MKNKLIAQAIKNYLVELAVNDKLPLDLNNLSTIDLQIVIDRAIPDEIVSLEKAEDFLCDSDYDVKEQLNLIVNQSDKDGSVMIDDVDGVVVWEKVVYSFTCDQFLEYIGYN